MTLTVEQIAAVIAEHSMRIESAKGCGWDEWYGHCHTCGRIFEETTEAEHQAEALHAEITGESREP